MSFNDKEIETIRRTIVEKANDDEFRMFMHLAKSYGLDSFNGEIFFWKMNGKPTIMTSRDGYLKIADSHPSMMDWYLMWLEQMMYLKEIKKE
ncbi:MAG: recombinase RecT [Bacillota bacterium]